MIPSRGENYKIEIYKLKENSPYEWENIPFIICYGRPATTLEVKRYRIQKGVHSSTDSNFIYCSNLPGIVKDGYKIKYLGKEWTIETVGYYYDANQVVNARIMSDEYLAKRSPKGLTVV